MDLRVYFPVFPSALNRYLKGNIDNKSSMNIVVFFLKPFMDLERI